MGRHHDHDRDRDRFRNFAFGFGGWPHNYDYGYDYDNYYSPSCYELHRVHTRYGWRSRREWICD
jgi:hypothetical protein